ncbi:MAG: hypothetical protein PWP23_951 [Candidatus Sumerlaeota bacterium]|nr:hypothetical protein [Candidatus Sumerlaeota bacterium]
MSEVMIPCESSRPSAVSVPAIVGAVVMALMTAVLVSLEVAIVPLLINRFEQQGMELPGISLLVLNVDMLMRQYWFLFLAFVVGAGTAGVAAPIGHFRWVAFALPPLLPLGVLLGVIPAVLLILI